MARLSDFPDSMRVHLETVSCPHYDSASWVTGPPLRNRRVVIVSTAGLHRLGDRPFTPTSVDYRVIPGDLSGADLVMSHVSTNFDRSGFQDDANVVMPIDRLRELADDGFIGSVADYHYSFMGGVEPELLEDAAGNLAPLLRADRVDAALLVPI